MSRSTMQDILGGGGNRGFDEYGTRLAAAQKSHVAAQSDPVVAASTAAVQGSYAEYYDPEDKNADWSGFVSKPRERQHASNPTAQRVQVGASDLGFMVPGSNSSTSDWSRPGKRTAFPAHPPVNNENESANIAPPIGNPRPTNQHATTANLLGGPVPVDARYRGDNRFETEAQAAQRSAYGGTGTQVNQLTDKARSVYVRGKKEVEPMYEQSMKGGGYDPRQGELVRGENPYAMSGSYNYGNSSEQMMGNDGLDNRNLVGYRQHHGGQMQSFMKGLAGSIADSIQKPSKRDVTCAPFATDGTLPTDPYMNSRGERNKDMFVENYNGGGKIPGYTGGGGRRNW